MLNRYITSIVFVLITCSVLAQQKTNFGDIQAIKNRNYIFYNVGGFTITTQEYSSPFVDKKLRPIYRDYKIKRKKQTPEIDSNLSIKHYKFSSSSSVYKDYKSYYICYFIENKGRTSVVTFAGFEEPSAAFMTDFIKKFVKNDFSKEIYVQPKIDSISFVGRYIKLGPGCNWMGVRNIQCPYNGQMDWTLLENMEETHSYNQKREAINTHQKKLKLISKDSVNIQFEGIPTKALKIVYDVKGFSSFILNLQSGAKNLTVYYIAQKVRDKNVSCILSHWNNDRIQSHGLPALLGEVMRLEKK